MRSVLVSLYDNVIQPFIARTEKWREKKTKSKHYWA